MASQSMPEWTASACMCLIASLSLRGVPHPSQVHNDSQKETAPESAVPCLTPTDADRIGIGPS